MTLNNKIITLLKNKSGLEFDKAGDFDLLSTFIFKNTKRTIGVTTLKRLFNYINDDRKANEYTLNTIAIYLEYENWVELVNKVNLDSVWGYEDETVYVQALEMGSHIEISYLNRNVIFLAIKRDEKIMLRVEKSENSSLRVGDECDICYIRKGSILEARHVYRGSNIGNYKTQGEISSINLY